MEKNIFKLIRKNTTGLFTFKWFDVRMEKAFICIKAANSTCYQQFNLHISGTAVIICKCPEAAWLKFN